MHESKAVTASRILPLIAACLAGTATAQSISVSQPARAGTPVTIIVNGGPEAAQETWCGFRIEYGNGDGRDVKVERSNRFPVRLEYTWDKPGTYPITVQGKKVTTHYPCPVAAQTTVTIGGDAPVAQAVGAKCPAAIPIRNAAGQQVSFNVRQFVAESGGVAAAREKVLARMVDAQGKALDAAQPEQERNNARALAQSLNDVRQSLVQCE